MSNPDNAGQPLSRVCVDADRGPLIEDILLSVAADLTRAFEALGYPTLRAALGDDAPLAETQTALLGVACTVMMRVDERLTESERAAPADTTRLTEGEPPCGTAPEEGRA